MPPISNISSALLLHLVVDDKWIIMIYPAPTPTKSIKKNVYEGGDKDDTQISKTEPSGQK